MRHKRLRATIVIEFESSTLFQEGASVADIEQWYEHHLTYPENVAALLEEAGPLETSIMVEEV